MRTNKVKVKPHESAGQTYTPFCKREKETLESSEVITLTSAPGTTEFWTKRSSLKKEDKDR